MENNLIFTKHEEDGYMTIRDTDGCIVLNPEELRVLTINMPVGKMMLHTLIYLDTAIMPDERKYDEWGYCRIHREILDYFDRRVKAAIRAAEGE